MSADDRAVHTLGHLALALSGACLTIAELPYLPELPLLLAGYLAALALSWWSAGRWALSNAAANGLGLLIIAATTGWVMLRLQAPTEGIMWFEDLAIHALLVPFLGPVVMALLAVRLFQPRAPGDFWVLQGLGLLQVALGCVLAGDTLFGPVLLAYLVTALCALAARERQAQRRRSAAVSAAREARGGWALFGLRWGAAAAGLTVPLFLVTPRHDGPEWRPFDRFLARPDRAEKSRTGFSDEIDLNRTGLLELDDSAAFSVRVTDAAGRPVESLPFDQRWRGVILDNYEEGSWRSDLTWPGNGAMARTTFAAGPADAWAITFKVNSRTGGLFLADPLLLGPMPGQVPVRALGREGPLFFESGSSAVPQAYLPHSEYRYVQRVPASGPRDRAPAVRLRNGYVVKLLQLRVRGLVEWSHDLLRALAKRRGERGLLEELDRPRAPWEGLPPGYWETVGRLFRDHLATSGEYAYSLSRERARPDLDPVMDFLAHTRSGHCERFAAALALLLRSQGVPARVVKGYRGADPQGDGNYVVRQSHAHAWVEAAVPAGGDGPLTFEWLALDATPDGDGEMSRSALARWWQLQQRTGRELWEELIVGYNSSQQASLREGLTSGKLALAALPWVGLAGGAFGLVVLARHARRRWRPRAAGAGSMYRHLCELLRRALAVTPAPGETPAELARRAGEVLARREATAAVAGVPGRVVEMYYRARYGGAPATAAELAEAAEGLAGLGRALGAAGVARGQPGLV